MAWLKHELARTRPDLRLAFSRPGLITLRSDLEGALPPTAIFARATGYSLGFADSPAAAAARTSDLEGPWRVHVFARDVDTDDDAPPIDDRPDHWRAAILEAAGARAQADPEPAPGDRVVDVILPPLGLAEPALVGWHIHDAHRPSTPGGVARVIAPADAPSRAYAKLAEALAWSQLPHAPGEVAVEIGASPGGAALALLHRDLHVIGVDPGHIAPIVLGDSRFRHLGVLAERVRSRDLPDRVDWLLLDANLAPHRAMVGLAHLLALRSRSIRGLLLTLKLNDAGVVEDLPQLLAKVTGLPGVREVRATQLPSAHQEVTVWAPRSSPHR